MTPEQKAREMIDKKLEQSGWIIQNMKQLNLAAGLGVAVREFPTSNMTAGESYAAAHYETGI